MIDEAQEETAALYALHLLEGEELVRFESALALSPELQQLVRELQSATAHCALLVPPAAPSAALRTRILASLTATAPEPGPRAAPPALPFRRLAWLGWSVAAGFAVLATYLAFDGQQQALETQAARQTADLTHLNALELANQLKAERIISLQQIEILRRAQTEAATAASRITDLERAGDLAALKIDTLVSLLGDSPQARAIAVWNPSTQEGVLNVSRLPALAADQDYQLWVVDPQYPIPVDGGVFRVDPATGAAHYRFKAGQPVRTVAKFAVSSERKGGVPKAEGPMVLLSE